MTILNQTPDPRPHSSYPATKQMDDSRSAPGNSSQESSNSRPVYALPREVLADIFALASTPCASKRGLSDSLLVISVVCKRWRLIAIGTKILWSHIDVSFCECNDNKRTLRISDASLLWLRRAKGTPIHLHFWENPILGHLPIYLDLRKHLSYMPSTYPL
ncbi:hypothetical protein FRC08_011594 [Ceratobasidium sp. 394]|nr:hypothetical protein FRC08_011594 [Ceratobasidium sp. 394]